MDSDDNDFQNQNFGLAGEDSSRFPRTLQTFSLPKFNFDDQLQVQLRFDSLAGSDCLLGMQGQEDNWIEEFSPRHGAIDFSSDAAESCSITRHNNIWFEATSSESVEMLLKSVGEDDMMNKKLVNKETNKLTTTESGCIIEDNVRNDPVGLNEDVVAVQLHSVGTSQDPEVEKLEDKTNLNLDDKLHIPTESTPEKGNSCENLKPSSDKQFLEAVQSDYYLNNASTGINMGDDSEYSARRTNKLGPMLLASCTEDAPSLVSANSLVIVPQPSTDSENLKPPPAGTKFSASYEFLEVFQSDNSLHNASMSKGLTSKFDCPAQKNNEPSTMLLTCSPDTSSVMHTDNMSIVGDEKKLKQIVEECSDIGIEHESEILQPDNRTKGSCRKFSISNEVGHGHVEDHAFSKDACNMTDSSNIDPSSVALTLLNSSGLDSASSKNCVGSLGSIVSHENLADNDSESDDKSIHLTSADSKRCKGVERESFEVDNEDSIQKLPQNTVLTEHTRAVSYEEEPGNSKSAMADGQESQLCNKSCGEMISSSGLVVDQQSLALTKNERQLNEAEDGGRGKIDKSDTLIPDSAVREKAAEYDLEDFKKSSGDLGGSQCLDVEKSSLVNDVCLSVQISDTSNTAKSNEDKLIYVEPSSYGKVVTNSVLDLRCASTNIDSLVVVEKEIGASEVRDSSLLKTDTAVEKLHVGEAVGDLASVGIKTSSHSNLRVLPQLQSKDLPFTIGDAEVKEVAAGSFLPESDCIKDSNTYLPAEKNDSVNLTRQAALSNTALCSLAPSNSVEKNGEHAGLDKVCIRAADTLLCTSGGMDQGKDDKSDPEDDCNRENFVQTISGSLNISTDHPSVETMLKSNAVSTNSLKFESDNQYSSEAKCGSPAFISCDESVAEHPKGDAQLPISTPPASETASIHQGKCAIRDHNQNTMSEDDESFTFEIQLVQDPSHKDTGNDWKPFSDMHSSETPKASAENTEAEEKNSKVEDKLSDISNAEHKKKQASSPSTRKARSSKSDTKRNSQQKQAKGGRNKKSSLSPGLDSPVKNNTGKDVIQEYPCLDSSTSKSSCTRVQATDSADNNVSVSSAASFHQPFTDLQQVQLRAQIFVYGSLIQGVPPDEACMVSAFGGTDGGRSSWEGPVRTAFERFSLQKSPFSTPVHSRLGVSTTEQASHSSSLYSKALKFPSGQNSNKIVPSVAANVSGYWPSPFWSKTPNDGLPSSIPRGSHLEFNQSVSPLHAYQSLQSRPGTSNVTPWLSQSPRPPIWVFPPQNSPLDAAAQYSGIHAAETVPVPTRDSSVLRASNAPLTSSLPNQGPGTISASLELREESEKNFSTPVSSKNEPAVHKSRRKKKVSPSQEIGPTFAVSQTQPECTLSIEKQISAPAISSLPPTAATSCLVSATSHALSPDNVQTTSNSDVQERASTQVEMLTGIEQSKIQAENAAAEAAAAVKLSQDTWTQLASQRESGLVSEVEKKLVSAAVAIAAAASVAKAAAAAAKLASEAAMQAKMMADDALNMNKTVSATQHTEGSSVVGKSLGWLSPTTVMKTKDKVNGSNSIISAAREASRKRVEAASSAIKRAENLDALLKAAEQALESVSHAGTIISMGDPLPFSMHELVKAGPNRYWKVDQANNRAVKERKYVQAEEVLVCDQEDSDESLHNEQLINKQNQKVADMHRIYTNIEPSVQAEENDAEKDLENASNIAPTDLLSKDSSGGSRSGTGIKKGSLVEVAAIEDGLRGAWFSAWVLDLKDDKAYVCYKDLLCDEGHDQLKEWIPLESDSDRAPRIRAAHPLTITKYEGTRKRRREAVGNHAWDVGDRVDVWLRDGWWEGIVTEKNLEDVTKLTIHFPAGGDSSFVRSWNLRPSLIWKDGQWVEWTRDRHGDTHDTNQADTPYEKRRKTTQHENQCFTETEGRTKVLTENDQMSGSTKVVESSTLNLSEKDKIFCMGGNVKEKDDTISNRVRRTVLQKEGSRVIFGVPKPGKKRKFMEVSKHYTSEITGKLDEVNYSSKFTKSLIPKASLSWRESSRANPKGKQVIGSKNTTSKASRPQNVHSSSLEKGNPSIFSMSSVHDAEHNLSSLGNLKASSMEDANAVRKNQLAGGVSYSSIPVKVAAPGLESRLPPLPVTASLKKKNAAIAEQTSGKGKDLPAMDEFTRSKDKISEDATEPAADVVEPRRSRRRIQPTSRLLEGLQSSLIMSKIPSVSHDKGVKGMRRGASSSQGHGHR